MLAIVEQVIRDIAKFDLIFYHVRYYVRCIKHYEFVESLESHL